MGVPDWFYRTVSRPLLFRLPAETAQSFACGMMRMVGNLPAGLGGTFIDFLGHMRPDARLSKRVLQQDFVGPVGLGIRLDGEGLASNAWTRFGFSFLELGPVTKETFAADNLRREEDREALYQDAPATISPDELAARLHEQRPSSTHLIIRLQPEKTDSPQNTADELLRLATPLRSFTHFFSLDLAPEGKLPAWSETDWNAFWHQLKQTESQTKWLLVLPITNEDLPDITPGSDGILVDAHQRAGETQIYSPAAKPWLLTALKKLRAKLGDEFPLIASGGIHQPQDAADAIQAGATLVQIDTGLIYSGPGLPKRINEAMLSLLPAEADKPEARLVRHSWFWTALMGLGMLLGSLLALWIAMTRVLLPYDEAFCGITRTQLQAINERIIPFMSHDRVTLAGAMIAIGILYLSFSWFGSRRGEHWAKVAVLASAGMGFFSFFLFLGFDYFDPFHGFVTVILFQLFIQGMVGEQPAKRSAPGIDWIESTAWRRGQLGQLLLVLHSIGLLGAGLIICGIGVNDVFVQTDLNYLKTELSVLREANERLLPLVAHDRATLGGMLLAVGIIYLLGSMWGMRRGARWLWHAFLWSGLAAYTCAIGVHFHVGYVDWHHLLPAFAGLWLLLTGLGLSHKWLTAKDHQ